MRSLGVCGLIVCVILLFGKTLYSSEKYAGKAVYLIDSVDGQPERIVVEGVVYDTEGETMVGVNILERGTTNGVITDRDGRFSIRVNPKGTLLVSFVGYKTKFVSYDGRDKLQIILEQEYVLLDDVIVTALGIRKQETSLAYATARVNKDELVRVKDPNMIVALMGKIAGMQVNKSASGIGGSAKVIMRGNRSVAGNNQPLYVIDGVPMLNESSEQPNTAIGGWYF